MNDQVVPLETGRLSCLPPPPPLHIPQQCCFSPHKEQLLKKHPSHLLTEAACECVNPPEQEAKERLFYLHPEFIFFINLPRSSSLNELQSQTNDSHFSVRAPASVHRVLCFPSYLPSGELMKRSLTLCKHSNTDLRVKD